MKTIFRIKILLAILISLCYQPLLAQNKEIKGIVTSAEDGEPLIGATISVKGNEAQGVVTDIEGKYILQIPNSDCTLVVAYLGMKTQELKAPSSGILNISLEAESMNLDEVVVTGYGNFSKSSFTGSANTLRADMMKNVPVMTVEQKLQGMTTGVNITSSSGQPGANQSIRIRGMGSFNASQEPLFVIDGVPVTSGSLSTGGADAAYMNNSKTNIMSTLNPSDIENITVIKDAAAASLYGSRAANGVILITTKQGKAGRTQVSLNIAGGFSDAAVDFRPTLSGDQRYELLYEGLYNYALDKQMKSPSEYAGQEIGKYAYVPELGYTDWRKELLRTAIHQNYEASVSGGNERTTFYASLGYNSQEGLAKNSSLDRYSARLNMSQKVGKYGEVGANVMFTQMNQEMNEERGSSINPFLDVAMLMNPSMTVRDKDGNYVGAYPGTTLNPLRDILTDYNRTRMTRMFSTGYASIEPLKGLKLKETLSYDYTIQKDSRYFNPLSAAGPKSGSDAQTSKGFIEYGKLISSTSLNYVHTFNYKHHLDVLAAYEIESYQTDKASGERSRLPSNSNLVEPDNASVLNSFISSTQAYRMLSYLSRLNYDYDDRYYIAGSFRRDGSSRLSPKNRWGNFWSVSGMWHLSNESFMKPIKHILSDVKIRASYGVNGNQPGSLYGYMGLYTYGQSYMGGFGSYESSLANPNLKWEKNYNLNIGLDLAFLSRIFLSIEYYNRDTKDLLYSLPISATTGFTNYLSNVGQLNNKGVELELRTINFATPHFNWSTVLNLSHNSNKIISLNGQLEQSIEGTWFIHKVGLPYHTFYVKEFAGVDPQNGDALYYTNTLNKDGSYSREITNDISKAQAIPYKSVNPKISGGLTNILNYKQLDLSFTLTYSLGGYSFDKLGTYIENGTTNIYTSKYNLPAYAMDRWQKPGDQTDVPRFVYNQSASDNNSSRYIHSTDHLRLKNLTLGYTLPREWTRKVMVNKARFYFSGSNLLTWAKWKQYDPETPVNGEVFCEAPPMRTFSFGVQLTF
ncbi:SusC/RagA family TonB-linked outer membrane protein [Phocaeicola sp.]|jgi:TonB-linked SusC/RagA family outer membrane protein|uniref:SusC/RagA family TonB-linked outer membrane protein n=1 Tax=Phocaeicola TaxID=909656 RepID=UPI003869922E